jgi:hypothetical protein
VVLGLAEFAEHGEAILANQLLVGLELRTLATFITEKVQFEDDLVGEFAEVLEVQPLLQLDLTNDAAATLDETDKFFNASAALVNPTLEGLSNARLTKLVLAVLEFRKFADMF